MSDMKFCTACKHLWGRKGVCTIKGFGDATVINPVTGTEIVADNPENGFPVEYARLYLCQGSDFEPIDVEY